MTDPSQRGASCPVQRPGLLRRDRAAMTGREEPAESATHRVSDMGRGEAGGEGQKHEIQRELRPMRPIATHSVSDMGRGQNSWSEPISSSSATHATLFPGLAVLQEKSTCFVSLAIQNASRSLIVRKKGRMGRGPLRMGLAGQTRSSAERSTAPFVSAATPAGQPTACASSSSDRRRRPSHSSKSAGNVLTYVSSTAVRDAGAENRTETLSD